MFKLFRVLHFPGRAQDNHAQNHFYTYAIVMPDNLLPIIQSRLTTIILSTYYGKLYPHDLRITELLELDKLMSQYDGYETYHLVLDGRILSLLKRFIETERVLTLARQTTLSVSATNAELWTMLGDLLQSINHPTRIVNMSFTA